MRLPFARIACATSAAALVFSTARAQDINIDVASFFGTPTAVYGAGAAMPGAWNNLTSPTGPYSAVGLLNTAGVATAAGVTSSGGFGDFSFNNAGTAGDDQALMDDCQDVGGVGGTTTWTFTGLTNATYDVYTYAWAPDSATFISNVTVPGGGAAQNCGGNWPGAQTLGITYTKHTVVVAGGTLSVTISTVSGFASVNGFQLDMQGVAATSPFCFGDGSGTQCPCFNGTTGNGCANSSGPGGAKLTSTGSNDISVGGLTLTCTGMLPGSFCIFSQGTATLGGGAGVLSPGSDGLDCIGGTIVRIGRVSTGLAGSASLSNVPAAGGVPPAGGLRHYQAIYRNSAAFCTPATLNGSNGLSINWVP